jgi:hypothetical protein
MVLSQGLLVLFNKDRDRCVLIVVLCSLALPRGTFNRGANKNTISFEKGLQMFRQKLLERQPFSDRRRERKNVIRLRRLERIEVPGVQETSQTLTKNVSRAQALRRRVFLRLFLKNYKKGTKQTWDSRRERSCSILFLLLDPSAPQDFQKVAQSL